MTHVPPGYQSAYGPGGPVAVTQEEVVSHTSVREKRPVKSTRMQLNLTSMIDVIFQLLIYFVVTASFAVGEGIIPAQLPVGPGKPKDDTKPPTRPLNIVVKSAGVTNTSYRLYLEGAPRPPTTFSELWETLAALRYDPNTGQGTYKSDNPVIIKPDGDVRWQHVVNAFNAAVRARYTNISFAQAQ